MTSCLLLSLGRQQLRRVPVEIRTAASVPEERRQHQEEPGGPSSEGERAAVCLLARRAEISTTEVPTACVRNEAEKKRVRAKPSSSSACFLNVHFSESITVFFWGRLLLLQLLAGREKIRVLKAEPKKGETPVFGPLALIGCCFHVVSSQNALLCVYVFTWLWKFSPT